MYFSHNMGNDETSRVKQIRVTSPWFRVSGKIYAGMPVKNAQETYKLKKVAKFRERGNQRTLYDDVSSGIAFDVNNKELITGITIHVPGREVTATYLAFFPDLEASK
jgi:hypothetical protein